MVDATGLAEKMLGLKDVRVLDVVERPGELEIHIETTATVVFCEGCAERAEAHDRMRVELRDLSCFGRLVRLVWRKRRWRCRTERCMVKTFTESSPHVIARQQLTCRAGQEVCRQVGKYARSVSSVAGEFGICWASAMSAVAYHGRPLVDDPRRVGKVRYMGVDETSWLRARKDHPTLYATSVVDLPGHKMIDIFRGHRASELRRWCKRQDPDWLGTVRVVAMDLTERYRRGLDPHLSHARRVADPFHVVRVANRCVDDVRRRVQNEVLGHRGRKDDPLYRIRKLLVSGHERLDERGHQRMLLGLRLGDPRDEILGAWLAKESLRDVYLTDNPKEAAVLLDKAITGCLEDEVREIRALGRTLRRWRREILEHHRTGASNGPTEAMNLLVKKVKRCGHGFTNFEHYRLRVLLYTGGIKWPEGRRASTIRSGTPH